MAKFHISFHFCLHNFIDRFSTAIIFARNPACDIHLIETS